MHLDHVEELRSAESLDVLPDEVILRRRRPPPPAASFLKPLRRSGAQMGMPPPPEPIFSAPSGFRGSLAPPPSGNLSRCI